MTKNTFILLSFLIAQTVVGQQCATISSKNEVVELNPNISVWDETQTVDAKGILKIQEKGLFKSYTEYIQSPTKAGVQWIHFQLKNQDQTDHDLKISLAFVDKVDYYFWIDTTCKHVESGDLMPPSQRSVDIGQMCFVGFTLPAGKTSECFVRLQSQTEISEQFRDFSLRSIRIYAEKPFEKQFVTSRIYQAAFYGAIIVMLFYNFFIFATTRSKSYLAYVGFLFIIILFMASNNGYLAELVLDKFPRTDLYLRFISAPLLLIAFLIFTRHYLESKKYSLLFDRVLIGLGLGYLVILLLMVSGFWQLGRTLVIVTTPISFIAIVIGTVVVMRKGYTPARYFLIANILLIIGASFFAFERYNIVVENPLTQYSIQLSVIFQSVFFSIGLADRIKLVQHQISSVQLENEKLAKLREIERKKLTEDKNLALEESNKVLDAFIYKTAHDIRGPIARLMGLSNLGLMDVQDTKALGYFSMLKNNSYYLNSLINRLSTAYDIRNREVKKQEFELEKLVNEILNELSFHEEYTNVRFNTNIPQNLIVQSDMVLVRFILINIMDNAMKFKTQESNVKFEIDLDIQINDTNLIITIKENGIGVREEEIPFLFEMFSKAAGKYKSPGLGLYMARISAEKLSGRIALMNNSKPTVFQVTIPLK